MPLEWKDVSRSRNRLGSDESTVSRAEGNGRRRLNVELCPVEGAKPYAKRMMKGFR